MKRIAAFFLLLGLAFAIRPAYPESTLALGYAHPQGVYAGASLALDEPVLGLDAGLGLDLAYAYPSVLSGGIEGQLLVFPTLTFMDRFASVGGFVRLPFGYDPAKGAALGLALGPRASLELDFVTLSAELGVGYYQGLFLDWGLAARAYLEEVGLEASASNQLGAPGFRLAFIYLF